MDRKAWIAIILSVLGLVLWQWYYVKHYSPRPQVAQSETVPGTPTPTPAQAPVSTPSPAREEPVLAARNQSLYSKSAEYVFSNDKGGIERAILLLHLGENQQAVFLNGNRAMPIGAIGENPGESWGGFAMETDQGKGEAVFTRRDADGLEITKRFILPESEAKDGNYVVRMDLNFRNAGNADVERKGYFVFAGGAAPIHHNDLPMYTKFDWTHEGKFETIDVNWFDPSSVPLLGIPIRDARSLYLEAKKDVTWTGVASQYFCTIVTTQKTKGISAWATRYDTRKLDNARVYGIQGGIGMPAFRLGPGESLAESFQIYAGPKDLAQLRKLGGGQDAVMNFGMFGFVSEFLLWAMNSLNAVFHNYAAAIIVLTIIIKTLLWPIQNKATNQMRKMSLLSPKMTELREKVQGRSPKNERGGDEALQRIWSESLQRLRAPPHPNSDLFWLLRNARQRDRAAQQLISLGSGSFPTGHRFQAVGFPGERSANRHGGHNDLAIGDHPKKWRCHAAADLLLHAGDFLGLLLQLCERACALLDNTESFLYPPTLPHSEQAASDAGKKERRCQERSDCCWKEEEKTSGFMSGKLSPREILDTMLGYLGFVFEIEEQERGGHKVLQIFTHEAERLIGRREQTLDDLQFLLNRILQASDPKASRVVVDVDHHRAMRDDALVAKVRHLAGAVKSTGRPLQTEPLNSYDRFVVHNVFKDDPDVMTWSPQDDAKLKRITIRLRKKNP